MVNTLPSKAKERLRIAYSPRFLPERCELAAGQSVSSSSSSRGFSGFAAIRLSLSVQPMRSSRKAKCSLVAHTAAPLLEFGRPLTDLQSLKGRK